MQFRSEVIEVTDYHAAVELYFERRWTDGLAIVPPTEGLAEAMIHAGGREAQEELGEVPPRMGLATVEKLAISAVMAGCKPEYFPVILAAVEAVLDPVHNLNGVQTTTHCSVPLVIVTGPIAKQLGINAKDGVFGSGFRANATIGRAIRLILWNLGGNYPGEVDRSTMAHPGKWTYCIAEEADDNPWSPLHGDQGLPAEANAVTVFTCEAPHSILAYGSAQEIMQTICSSLATLGNNNIHAMGETLVVFNPFHIRQFTTAGWSKEEVRQRLWEQARVRVGDVQQAGSLAWSLAEQHWPEWIDKANPSALVPLTKDPSKIHLVVVGGPTYFAACCPGWGELGGMAVTRPVRMP
jgi:hypothetical protein